MTKTLEKGSKKAEVIDKGNLSAPFTVRRLNLRGTVEAPVWKFASARCFKTLDEAEAFARRELGI